jgi:hypothetical protein
MRARVVAFLSVAVLLVTGVAFAHHGAASYDMEKKVTIKGTVTDFQFINPHVLIGVESKDPSGAVQKWQGELTSPNRLTRAGWTKSSLKVGDQITLVGSPAKSGATNIWISKVMGPTGEEMNLGAGE